MSCLKFTVLVKVDLNGKITYAAPIVKKFIGQPVDNLRKWMKGLGGFCESEL